MCKVPKAIHSCQLDSALNEFYEANYQWNQNNQRKLSRGDKI